jgi:flagellar biogenesis protein FliO
MKTVGKHTELTTNEAREGETTGHSRYVLGISLGLAVIVGVILYMIYF